MSRLLYHRFLIYIHVRPYVCPLFLKTLLAETYSVFSLRKMQYDERKDDCKNLCRRFWKSHEIIAQLARFIILT
jgi:hypothetical protein